MNFLGLLLFASIATISEQREQNAVTAPSPQEKQETVFQIKISPEQAAAIDEIVMTLGNTSLLSLGFKKAHLKELGDKLKGVGSLQFLGYIFTQPELKVLMKEIQKSSIKWNGLLSGIKPGLEKEAASKELFPKLPAFAKTLNANYPKLHIEAESRNWDGFVGVLVDAS